MKGEVLKDIVVEERREDRVVGGFLTEDPEVMESGYI